MSTFYEIHITKTCRPMGRTGEWRRYDSEIVRKSTIEEVKAYLKNEYGTCKKMRMYHDTDGGAEAIGYIYGFRTPPSSYDDCWHFEQHWIDIEKMQATRIIVR